ncbi:MAG: metallophosphoesterase family protein [Actinobacteria bacterium]|nr:metallophosphoesterase family protein [Actinomycetota bacterium]
MTRARTVAALYDIHGVLPALEAVLAEPDVRWADLVLVGGDAVMGPFPAETLEALVGLGERALFVRGNTDRVLGELPADDPWAERNAWVCAELGDEATAAVTAWPESLAVEIDGLGQTLFCHGSPRSDTEILTRATPPERLAPILAEVREPVVVCGHTHVQFDRRFEGTRLVNAGSLGMPYEGETGARWALLGPDVELRRTSYDVEAAANRVRASGLPGADEFAEEYVLSSHSAQEATETFEGMAAER